MERNLGNLEAETLTVREKFVKDGWARIPAGLSSGEVQQLTDEINGLERAQALNEHCLYFYEQKADSGERRVTRLERMWESLPTLQGGLGKRLFRTASDALGESVALFKDKINFRYAKTRGYAPHQDTAAGWLEYADSFVSVVIFLHSSTSDTGGFELATAHHREGRFRNTQGEMDADVFKEMEPSLVSFDSGDLLLLDGEAPHRTLANTTNSCYYHPILTFHPERAGQNRECYYEAKCRSFADRSIAPNAYGFRVFDFPK